MRERGKRWFDILLVLSFSSIILVVLAEYIKLPISGWLNQQNAIFRSLIIFLASACLWEFINKTGGIRLNDLNPVSYFKYPSIWLTSLICVFLVFIFDIIISRNDITRQRLLNTISNVSIFFAAGIVIAISHFILKPKINKKTKIKTQNLEHYHILNDPKKIIEWVGTENPINDEAADLFSHKYIAKKIREILDEGSNKNIGIIGGYGSGKSSIINLIISGKTKKEIFCKIEGWGFKENTAIEHILQLVIEELKLHFDCLSIANLPKQYHEAMNNSGNNILPVVGCFFQGTRNPKNILEKIDSILECVNKKLCIVLEDIDRNINDATFYNEVASLLNVTKHFNRISFIIAIGPKSDLDSILTKLCEHNEYIQRIDKKEVISVCDILIDYWHTAYPNDVKIQEREEIMGFLGFPRDENEEQVFQLLERDRPIDYISQLLDTPRKLKAALRETDTLWQQLHGEIDFKSFFLATILRAAAPEAYRFINDNIKALRGLNNRRSSEKAETEAGIKTLIADWKQVTENVSWHVESAQKVIYILFPIFRESNQLDKMISFLMDEKTLQGFMDDYRTDYWKRINVGMLLPDEIGDQTVLKAIQGWRKNHPQEVYIHNGACLTLSSAMSEVDNFADKVETFGYLLEAKEIRELASELFENVLKKYGNKANEDLCPGFLSLRRLALQKNYSGHQDWFMDELKRAICISLHFSNDLYYRWRHQQNYEVSDKTPTPELRKQFVEVFRKKFDGEPECLASILDQSNPWGLRHMLFIDRDQNTEDLGWLGKVFLGASQSNPKLLASYIACLVSDTERVHSSDPEIGDYYKNKINDTNLNEIFGSNIKPAMELLSREFEYPEFADDYKHAQTKSVIQNAREEARAWLKMAN